MGQMTLIFPFFFSLRLCRKEKLLLRVCVSKKVTRNLGLGKEDALKGYCL